MLASGQHPAGPSGPVVLQRMMTMYANLKSYRDTGEVKGKNTFRTMYKAPGKLYFAFTETDNPYLGPRGPWFFCSTKDGNADSYFLGKVEHRSLQLQIAGFTGVTLGAVVVVPTLFYPDMNWRTFSEDAQAKVLRREQAGGEMCFVVKTSRYTAWIGSQTFALHKLETQIAKALFTTIYKPELNPKLDDSAFVFKAPK
jgi:outer membrane lipoprotein-sorting protein